MTGHNRARGIAGEVIAMNWLRKGGFEILERNYAPKANLHGGEIDLIAKRGGTIHFIEVKMRATDGFGSGREAVTPSKQRTIRRLATRYLASRGLYERVPCCFDVIEITARGTDVHVEFLENCF